MCLRVGRQISGLAQNEDGGGWEEWSAERDKTSAKWIRQWLDLGGRILGGFLLYPSLDFPNFLQ